MTGWVGLERLLTADEVAEVLAATSTRTVDELRRSGALRAVRVGRVWRFHPDDVKAFVDELRGVEA